jgi:hypothetical protein
MPFRVTHRLSLLRPRRAFRALAPVAFVFAACRGGEPSGPDAQFQLGAVTITISGVPEGGAGSVAITGPGGTQGISASGTITGLAAGTYTVSAVDIVQGGSTYAPTPRTQTVTITRGVTANALGIVYAISTGSLSVTVTGLPSGVQGSVAVTGPEGFSAVISATTVLSNLAPGTYEVTAENVSSGIHVYAPTTATQSINVVASSTPAAAPVLYQVATGLLDVTISGDPGAGQASVVVSGPNGYSQPLSTSQLLSGLVPGTYTIAASPVVIGPVNWIPAPPSQQVVVAASTEATNATVAYNPSVGTLAVNVTGLPTGANAAITVTGPAGFIVNLTGSQSMTAPIGSYTIASASVSHDGTNYAAPSAQSASVTLNASTAVVRSSRRR